MPRLPWTRETCARRATAKAKEKAKKATKEKAKVRARKVERTLARMQRAEGPGCISQPGMVDLFGFDPLALTLRSRRGAAIAVVQLHWSRTTRQREVPQEAMPAAADAQGMRAMEVEEDPTLALGGGRR